MYIYVFLIAANRHGNLSISIFLDERSSGERERETFRFRSEGYSIIDGNVHENLHNYRLFLEQSGIYIHHPAKKREDRRSAACFIARCNNWMQMGAQVEREVR